MASSPVQMMSPGAGASTRRLGQLSDRNQYTRPGVSEEEIAEIRKCFEMMDTRDGTRAAILSSRPRRNHGRRDRATRLETFVSPRANGDEGETNERKEKVVPQRVWRWRAQRMRRGLLRADVHVPPEHDQDASAGARRM